MTIADIIAPNPTLWTFNAGGPESFDGTESRLTDEIVTVDVTLTEEHGREAEVTDNPVERGIDVVDHRRIKPIQLKMSGIISDTPNDILEIINGATVDARLSGGEARSNTAYEKLKAIFLKQEPIIVVTALEFYENMTFTSFLVNKNTKTGRVLSFTATLRELRFATTEFVQTSTDPVVAPTAKKKPKAEKGEEENDGFFSAESWLRKGQEAVDKVKNPTGVPTP